MEDVTLSLVIHSLPFSLLSILILDSCLSFFNPESVHLNLGCFHSQMLINNVSVNPEYVEGKIMYDMKP